MTAHEAGKGPGRRAGADDAAYREGHDRIDWGDKLRLPVAIAHAPNIIFQDEHGNPESVADEGCTFADRGKKTTDKFTKTYREYIAEAVNNCTHAWGRVPAKASKIVNSVLDAFCAMLELTILLVLPLCLPLVPLLAWLYMLSDESLDREVEEMRQKLRHDIHRNGRGQ